MSTHMLACLIGFILGTLVPCAKQHAPRPLTRPITPEEIQNRFK